MESLNTQPHQEQPDAGAAAQHSDGLEYTATATSNRGAHAEAAAGAAAAHSGERNGGQQSSLRSASLSARRDEVWRAISRVLVIPCDVNASYAAPVVTVSQEDSNIYTVLERHIKREYLLGSEKFWKLVRTELGLDTWRPRVQGAQLKALQGARLPQFDHELSNMALIVDSIADVIQAESSPEAMQRDLQGTIKQIQQWWENRNRREGECWSAVVGAVGVWWVMDG